MEHFSYRERHRDRENTNFRIIIPSKEMREAIEFKDD